MSKEKAPFHGGFQEASSAGGAAGARHGAGDRGALRGASEPGEHMEAAGDGGPRRDFLSTCIEARRGARSEGPGIARQDRRVDGGAGFFSARVGALSRSERVGMVDCGRELSLVRQCQLLDVSRSSQYYAPLGESSENLALMRWLDELHLAYPFYGSRQMVRHLRREGVVTGRHRVRRLMRLMAMEAIYRKPRTSVANPEHRVYPYLLRDLMIDRADQAWCADITYIPVTNGFFYLVAVMDWASRHVLSWRLSNTMDSVFCIDALEAALHTGTPEIFNTDQGSQFTSNAFTDRIRAAGARCSMDGRGRYLDNIFIERLWRSLKYESVYLHELSDGRDAERVIGAWFNFYNNVRPHSSLDGRTPGDVYRGTLGRCGMSHPGSVCAGNATAVAASSRYAAPPLRSGPSGDTATAVAKWLIMTGRVLPVITDRHLTSAPTEDPTMPLTSSRAVGNVRSSRAKNQSEYTLSLPLDCPTNQDHLIGIPGMLNPEQIAQYHRHAIW